MFDFDKITGVTVELAVDNLTLLHHLYLDKPYVLVANISIPAGLKESPYELENFGVCMIMIFMHSSGSGVYFYRFPPKYQKITGPEYPFVSKRLTSDIMSETGQKVMKILKDNGLTRRLMESFQCEVREIVRWMLSDGVIDSTAVVTLVCEEKGYEFSVRIDLNAERIKEIYCYPLQK